MNFGFFQVIYVTQLYGVHPNPQVREAAWGVMAQACSLSQGVRDVTADYFTVHPDEFEGMSKGLDGEINPTIRKLMTKVLGSTQPFPAIGQLSLGTQ